jgi:hypothetical protein
MKTATLAISLKDSLVATRSPFGRVVTVVGAWFQAIGSAKTWEKLRLNRGINRLDAGRNMMVEMVRISNELLD